MISITQNFDEGTSPATIEQCQNFTYDQDWFLDGLIQYVGRTWVRGEASRRKLGDSRCVVVDEPKPDPSSVAARWDGARIAWTGSYRDGDSLNGLRVDPTEGDHILTAAWYGRGEKPEPTVDFEFQLIETSKPAKPELFVVHGEGRYQHLIDGDT